MSLLFYRTDLNKTTELHASQTYRELRALLWSRTWCFHVSFIQWLGEQSLMYACRCACCSPAVADENRPPTPSIRHRPHDHRSSTAAYV